MPSPVIRLHPDDNVVVARADLAAGTDLPGEGTTTAQAIARGHKVAVHAIPKGEAVRRYGQVIGFAAAAIAAGEHVHVHNVELHDFAREAAFGADARPTDFVPEAQRATFQGFRRADGRVGTRNYVAVLSTVNCSGTVARAVAESFRRDGHLAGNPKGDGLLADFPNVDGVIALTHGSGCAMPGGEGLTVLQRTLWGYARNPNVAAVVLIGLGCEVNHLDFLTEVYGIQRGPRFQAVNIQDLGGTRRTVAHCVDAVRAMLPEANRARRETVPASELVVGLQCGGSDGYSGISANPALGAACDRLVRHGGTVVLSETPEIYGAEHLLARRAVSGQVGEALMRRIRWWEDYTRRHGASMDNNPSPGNKAGGLTTILEKSLGAAAKAGTTNLTAVREYAQAIDAKGLVFMDTPGYDPCSATGQIAGGCNLVVFTTGRGSVSGFKPAPCLKLATNTPMYEKLSDDMDLNCGTIVDGTETVEDCGRRIFDKMLACASGEPSRSEELGFGDLEFVPWQINPVM